MTDSAAAGKPATSAAEVPPVTRALSEYIAAAPRRPLPAAVGEKTKHHLLDTLAAMIAGSRCRPGASLIRAHRLAAPPRSPG